mmetsp:Transcript_104705/g.176952  ORF Transcript_104705/g.176952 Transcript_104705/m.176952 type:complete len:88 (-) Transcript_104705:648-911(-)
MHTNLLADVQHRTLNIKTAARQHRGNTGKLLHTTPSWPQYECNLAVREGEKLRAMQGRQMMVPADLAKYYDAAAAAAAAVPGVIGIC